jgi:integrase
MARDKVMRNVVSLCSVPYGLDGRPSKSLTFDQAKALLAAAERSALHAYVVRSLLTGARTEELRALTWAHVDLEGRPDIDPPIPPSVHVWRSVSVDGDTKTRKSRRSLALPAASRSSPTNTNARAYRVVTRSSSPAKPAPSSTSTMSYAPSGRSSRQPGSTLPNGHRANCGTASCRCCPTTA